MDRHQYLPSFVLLPILCPYNPNIKPKYRTQIQKKSYIGRRPSARGPPTSAQPHTRGCVRARGLNHVWLSPTSLFTSNTTSIIVVAATTIIIIIIINKANDDIAAVQAALVVTRRVPRRGVAEAQGEPQEQEQEQEQERDRRGRRRAQGLYRVGFRIRADRLAWSCRGSAFVWYFAGFGSLLRCQQALQRHRFQLQVNPHAEFVNGVGLRHSQLSSR